MRSRAAIVAVYVLLAAFAVAPCLCSCGESSPTQGGMDETLRIGYAIEAPYAFLDPAGEVTGIDPEVAKRVADRLGVKEIRWVLTEFGSLISGLQTGRFDVIAAGMFITAARAESVDFSRPTFRVRQGLLVPARNPAGLHSYEDAVSDAAVKVAVISGAVEERLLLEMGIARDRLVRVPEALAGVRAVESGVADALALSSPTFCWMRLNGQLGTVSVAEPFQQPELAADQLLGFGGFVFRTDDEGLRNAWNEVLGSFVGSQEHLELLAAFGMTSSELPGGVTTEQIIRAETVEAAP